MQLSFKKLIISVLLVPCILHAAAAYPTIEPVEYARTYVRYLGITLPSEVNTSDEVLRIILGSIRTGVYHQHVKEGSAYGYSFIGKNQPPIKYVVDLLTAQKKWERKTIETTSIRLADVGCGLGLSAISLVAHVVETYKRDGWTLSTPIKLDLFDISPEHQPALQALANFVNTAYDKYFRVTAVQCDITQQPIAAENSYNISLLFNLMHYVPETKWRAALGNIVNAMKN